MKTTYIVSGYMRTGTSMMMQCISGSSNLEIEYDEIREELNKRYGDEFYLPNPRGFFELALDRVLRIGFPREFEGKLIKVLYGGLMSLVAGDYKIVFMMRDKEEIRQSYEAFFDMGPPKLLEHYDELMKDTIERADTRNDTDIVVFNYRDVVDQPQEKFQILKDRGWPIDVSQAASIVDPKLYRFRREILAEGI
jgi:hypothetical protein